MAGIPGSRRTYAIQVAVALSCRRRDGALSVPMVRAVGPPCSLSSPRIPAEPASMPPATSRRQSTTRWRGSTQRRRFLPCRGWCGCRWRHSWQPLSAGQPRGGGVVEAGGRALATRCAVAGEHAVRVFVTPRPPGTCWTTPLRAVSSPVLAGVWPRPLTHARTGTPCRCRRHSSGCGSSSSATNLLLPTTYRRCCS